MVEKQDVWPGAFDLPEADEEVVAPRVMRRTIDQATKAAGEQKRYRTFVTSVIAMSLAVLVAIGYATTGSITLSTVGLTVGLIVSAMVSLPLAAIYFLPAIVAGFRGHRNYTAIFVLNGLLGWTFIGWTVAMVWAFSAEKT